MSIDDYLRDMAAKNASDLHLKSGRPPILRIHGDLAPTDAPAMTDEEIEALVFSLMSEEQVREFKARWEMDLAYAITDLARFRVNAFYQLGHIGAAFRLIPYQVPTIDELGLPSMLKNVILRRQGLVLVTGPTGAGKSTSMAAMIEHLNAELPRHVVSIEDPVEFVYQDKKATINQRQIGTDTKSFIEALKRVLRQDPDVILMGEMRDRSSMEFAMHAAETGHLVMSTLHTNDARQTLDRVVDSFPTDAHRQIRSLFSLTLLAVLSQRLVRRKDGNGRVAAFEILVNSPNIAELIREGNTKDIDKAIAKGREFYRMQTFNQHLCEMVLAGTISQEEALRTSSHPSDLRLMLRGVGIGAEGIAQVMPAGEDVIPYDDLTPEELERLKDEMEGQGEGPGQYRVERGFEF